MTSGTRSARRTWSARDLYNADECFFTGTAAELTPIREVDDRAVGEGHRGPVTKELQGAFFAATKGETEKYADWLTHVERRRATGARSDRYRLRGRSTPAGTS